MIADPLLVRWESLAVVLATLALAVWAFRNPLRTGGSQQAAPTGFELQVVRPGAAPEIVRSGDGCVMGRGEGCTIVFDDKTVSKMHARLKLNGVQAILEDLDSTNGTLLNGRRLTSPVPLRRGDRIGLGANQIVFLGMSQNGSE